ncbi:ABC transporter permease [Microbacterium saperdae]|uniref:Osmoprotectant transport system permease protein n=1 Tax=Microbacterium saperdae TaxID=69368 RepID=A0A543BPX9_9MICO|nr:ABC transporter permease [Microbacterium saperdae]TQL86853.1 osmoprotectant transport system permease protein [Microbacterium saperdae]GGM44918.1 ABC transporter permease [Microbacterium saperdae]
MTGFNWEDLMAFLTRRADDILELTRDHLVVVLISIALASAIGIGLGILVRNRRIARTTVLTAAAVAITIPSLALLALLSPILGLGWLPTVVALVFYSLLPVVRNTVVGLREVPVSVLESARGMGLGPARVLFTVQLPIAWPVIMTGIRVAAQLTVGIAAIAAYVAGPGLGEYIFKGLSSLGSKNALNYALTGTVAVIILALVLDGILVLIARLTTSRGLRA